MSNDSTMAGYLTPIGDSPAYDQALEREISRWIQGVTGLTADKVVPRWTDPPTEAFQNDVTCCAFGITSLAQTLDPANVQISDGQSVQWAWEQMTVICCFYGPLAADIATTFLTGIVIEQNQTELGRCGLSLLNAGTVYHQPELINDHWVRRYDLTVTLSRKTTRTYNVKALKETPLHFFGD